MALTVGSSIISLSPLSALNEKSRLFSRILVRCAGSADNSVIVPSELVKVKVGSTSRKDSVVASYNNVGKKENIQSVPKGLEPLWDDGYGTQTMKDYTKVSMNFVNNSDGGPPRWFCPVMCGIPVKDSPPLLYLPGFDGTGAGLAVHEKALGKVFHVQCFHIPSWDRTPLEGLIRIVEETIMIEHTLSPNRPIYLLGDSFGGALALAVAARNPTIDLVLILANPGTSYERSQYMHPVHGLVRALPDEYYVIFRIVMSCFLGNYFRMEMVEMDDVDPWTYNLQLIAKLLADVPIHFLLAEILPDDTLKWRTALVKSAAAYANSRLHAVTAQVLVLASGKDWLVPSKSEAQRLSRLLKNCTIRVFDENGHSILMESGVNVLSTIKTTHMYRRTSRHDILNDFLPPNITEFKQSPMETWWYRLVMGATMFSTMEDGEIVRGLSGIPDEGPVLLVGNHMLWGFETLPFVLEFLREKKVVLHVLTHPETFAFNVVKDEHYMIPSTDILKLFGAIPASARNLTKLSTTKSFALFYPGGAREAFHRKGETYKLFWPDKQEFVRMAVMLGATIVPFGVVGQDDIAELIFDHDEMKRIPFVNHLVTKMHQGKTNVRKDMDGEIGKQQNLNFPIFLPKLPGRLYYMFGKPIKTKGKAYMLNDEKYLQELYQQIKCDVENNMAYLLKKREEDPCRGLVERFLWLKIYGYDIPSFDPLA
uniref:acyltransferase-like protein At1g54570, chloroplastic n=1 Tax=Erigeron canadensis TaxID=72917 RepID=UPI001CB95929|nr:acyltransferase-like protein At1g54570, chloroplastic [Erigeron canadensis]